MGSSGIEIVLTEVFWVRKSERDHINKRGLRHGLFRKLLMLFFFLDPPPGLFFPFPPED